MPRGAEPPLYVPSYGAVSLARHSGLPDDIRPAAWIAMQDRPTPPHVATQSAIARAESTSGMLAWRCAPCGGEWTEAGSAAAKKCTRCGTPRPEGA